MVSDFFSIKNKTCFYTHFKSISYLLGVRGVVPGIKGSATQTNPHRPITDQVGSEVNAIWTRNLKRRQNF